MENGVISSTYEVENRGWLAGPHGTDPGATPSVTLDVTAFTLDANGNIPSGTVVGKITASGLYAPYDNAAVDGTEVAKGLLFNTESVRSGQTRATNAIVVHAFVEEDRLPAGSGIDANAKTDLAHIIWL